MDTDTSDMYMGEGSYRYAENLRVVTNKDSNTGELHIIEGTDEVKLDEDITGALLGYTSIRDYIIAIVLAEYTNNTPSRPHFAPAVVPDPIHPDHPVIPDHPGDPFIDDSGDDSGDD